MKLYKYIICGGLALTLTLSSCESWLEVEPNDTRTTDYFYTIYISSNHDDYQFRALQCHSFNFLKSFIVSPDGRNCQRNLFSLKVLPFNWKFYSGFKDCLIYPVINSGNPGIF